MNYKYGHFKDNDINFITTDPATPRAFDNFLWNDSVFSCVQQTGVGYCDVQIDDNEAIKLYTGIGRVCDIEVFGRDHLMSRLIYIRDNETGEFWNIGWEPVCKEFKSFECEHGLGYTSITSEVNGIKATFLIFVPKGDLPAEIWKISIENTGEQHRSLSVFTYNQYSIMYKWGFESYGDTIYRGSWFDEEQGAMIVQKHPYIAPHNYLTGYMLPDRTPDGYDGSRRIFAGEYTTLANPEAVVQGQCKNSKGSSDATVGILQFNIDIAPDGIETIGIINGMVDCPESVAEVKQNTLPRINELFEELKTSKEQLVEQNKITTPDNYFNNMINGWLKQQSLYGATWCRWGWMGYRDIVQHGYGISSFNPERTKEILIEAFQHQNSSGLALRGWNPVDTKTYSDSALWLIFTLVAYLKETGDLNFLDKVVGYYDQGEATVAEHIDAALGFLENNKGAHDICLIKFGDWNDSLTGIGKGGKGESIWLSMAYKHALDLMTELYKHTNNTLAEDYSQRSAAIGKALHDNCWDGQWFVRCFDDNGSPVGSSKNEEGKIYLNAQSWALISGIADDEQKTSLLDACDENLKMDIGYRLVSPPYLKRDDYIGRISYLEPGICENGTIYTHGNAFFMLAQLMQNDGDKAYDVFKKITPGYLTDVNSPKQKCPPYIYANGYYAPEHRNNALQMEFTWITGSISWLINAIIDHMIGVRRDYDKLIIDPVLPKEWDTVTINRTFRNKLFNVTINQTGNKSVTLNGKKLENNFIYLSETADVNDVIVEI
ncbi:MAG: hypothetical protein PF692_08780 [Kiritimatiellae bacterium]|jgi:cellobiose phosphorylase|nr:hypothetical protein [Kiritimatiellia bacterium]